MDAVAAAKAAAGASGAPGKQQNRLSQVSTASSTASKRSRAQIGPWQLGRTLGRGSSGRVRLAKHTDNGQLAAVKIVPKSIVGSLAQGGGAPNGIEREVIIMKLIEHPNIMGLYDVWENKGELYLVLEYIEGGELFDYLISRGRLPEREAVHYFRQICYGVDYCHQFNICHRDLKPENLLLDKHRNIKIADFGMAALETQGRMLETSCGSPHYASPEIVAGKTYHGAPSDIWSCGIILFALLTGHLPFDDDNIRKLLLKVQSGVYTMPSGLSAEARDLISRMLLVDPGRRISMQGILGHPLLAKYASRRVPAENAEIKGLFNASRPVRTTADIDKEILRNLQTLWHRDDTSRIIQRLLSPEPNPEKTFYCLLLRYRRNHARRNNRVLVKQGGGHRRRPSTASHRSTRSVRSVRSARSVRSNRSVRSGRSGHSVSRYSVASGSSRRVQFPRRGRKHSTSLAADASAVLATGLSVAAQAAALTPSVSPQPTAARPSPAAAATMSPRMQMSPRQVSPPQAKRQAPAAPHPTPAATAHLSPQRLPQQPQQPQRTSPAKGRARQSPFPPTGQFADLLDQVFNFEDTRAFSNPTPFGYEPASDMDPGRAADRRIVSAPEPALPLPSTPSGPSESPNQYLLPMIFEEDRFADAVEEEVELKVYKRRKPPSPGDDSRLQISNLVSGESFYSYGAQGHEPRSDPHSEPQYPQPGRTGRTGRTDRTDPSDSDRTGTDSDRDLTALDFGGAPDAAFAAHDTAPVPPPHANRAASSDESLPSRQERRSEIRRKPVPDEPALRGSALRGPQVANKPKAKNTAPEIYHDRGSVRPPIHRASAGTPPADKSAAKSAALQPRSQNVPDKAPKAKSFFRRFTPRRAKQAEIVESREYFRQTEPQPEPVREEPKQGWFIKMLNIPLANESTKTLLSVLPARELSHVVIDVLQEWRRFGLTVHDINLREGLIAASITPRNVLRLGQSRFQIRVRDVKDGATATVSQERGSRKSFMRFVSELERVLGTMNVLGAPSRL